MNEIFREYFGYQNPLFLAKELLKASHVENNPTVNQAIYSMNELRKAVIRKEFPEKQNPNKAIGIVEKIFNFNNQQKGKENPSYLVTCLRYLLQNKCFKDSMMTNNSC